MNEPLFIAEVSSNHNRDLSRCLKFVDVAADIGCGAVKFQLFKIDDLFAPEALKAQPKLAERKQWELPVSFIPVISEHCRKRNIQFSCTPFYITAVNELLPYVAFYKIASYELLWDDLLSACAHTGKPVILSTGMASMPEIEHAFDTLAGSGCNDITLLQCVSGYPAPVSDCNLAVIETLRTKFSDKLPGVSFRSGWSDHSVVPGVLYRAVHRWNAEIVEFHLDIEGKGSEFSTGHCWLPDQIARVIDDIQKGFPADGNGNKQPAASEISDREWRADPEDGLRPFKQMRLTLSSTKSE